MHAGIGALDYQKRLLLGQLEPISNTSDQSRSIAAVTIPQLIQTAGPKLSEIIDDFITYKRGNKTRLGDGVVEP